MSARTLKGEALAGILGGGIDFKHGDIIQATLQAGPMMATTVIGRFEVSVVFEDGESQSVTIDVTVANDRIAVTGTRTNQDLRAATIKAATLDIVTGSGGDTQRGAVFAQLFILRTPDVGLQQLFGDYYYRGHHPSLGQVKDWRDGPGFLRTAAGTDQIAGVEVGDTVPAGAMWRVYAVEVVLVTDATVANRFVNLLIDDAATTITRRLFLTSQTAQTATLTRTHHWSPGTDANNTAEITQVDTITLLAKFPMSLQQGVGPLDAAYNLRTLTSATVNGAPGMLAGDNYGAPRYLVEEWLKART